ncbi:MAG: alpha/beta hydrolase [Pseudomonadota bacterium]
MLSLLATGALAYLAVIGALFVFQRDLIYRPFGVPGDPVLAGVPEMSLVVVRTEDGLEIASWHAPPARHGGPTVVLFHGNGGHIGLRAFKARRFLDAGLGVFLAGYRGYGGNPGRPTEDGLYSDARAVLGWLAERGASGKRLVLYGESLGAGVAVQMASEVAVAALVLESPFTSISEAGAWHFPFVPVKLLARDRFDSLSKIAAIDRPLLIVHGEQDTTIPVALARKLLAAARQPKEAVFLPQAGHNDLYAHGAAPIVLAFIERVAGAATTSRSGGWQASGRR